MYESMGPDEASKAVSVGFQSIITHVLCMTIYDEDKTKRAEKIKRLQELVGRLRAQRDEFEKTLEILRDHNPGL